MNVLMSYIVQCTHLIIPELKWSCCGVSGYTECSPIKLLVFWWCFQVIRFLSIQKFRLVFTWLLYYNRIRFYLRFKIKNKCYLSFFQNKCWQISFNHTIWSNSKASNQISFNHTIWSNSKASNQIRHLVKIKKIKIV